jgi:hypothetical protein
MATNINTILGWFTTGKKPTQKQFWASWQSFWHKDEAIPQNSITNLVSALDAKAEKSQFDAHKIDKTAHADLFETKEDKNKKGIASGYAPLDSFTKLASQYLNIVNDLTTGGSTELLSAEQGKILKGQVDAINALLASDNVNLDTVQELVDAIETVQASLSSILVNDLTTGGITKALTAEMGKLLQTNKVDKIAGKGLSTEDYSTEEKMQLAGIPATLGLKENKSEKGVADGYAPLNSFTKLAAQYLNIVNDLTTGGPTELLSAEQGKILKGQVDAINTLLASDNVNLDNVQELVDAIETIQMSLSTILVNDLTTGGTTKALTAEMGKLLDALKENTSNKSTSIIADYLSNVKFPSVKAAYDFSMSTFKKKFLSFSDIAGITHTFGAESGDTMFKFSNNSSIAATIPANATTPFAIGTVFECIALGSGVLSITGAAGVTISTNLLSPPAQNEVRRYTKIGVDMWTVEGSKEPKTFIPGVVFVASYGSDATGALGAPDLPYKTLNAAIIASNSDTNFVEFELLTGSTFFISVPFAADRIYNIKSKQACTVSFANATSNSFALFERSTFSFNAEHGSILFNGFWQDINTDAGTFYLNCKNITVTAFGITRNTKATVIATNLIHNSGGHFIAWTVDLLVNIINITGTSGALVGTGSGNVTFRVCTASDRYRIIETYSGGRLTLYHGQFTTTRVDTYSYIISNHLLSIVYQNNASVTGNVSMGHYNYQMLVTFTGICDFSGNTAYLLRSPNNRGGLVRLHNCYFIGLLGLASEEINDGSVIEIVDSYIEVRDKLINFDYWIFGGFARTKPIITFKGNNTIYCKGSTSDYIYLNLAQTNQFIENIGTLKTNGVLAAGITQNNLLP